MSMGAVAVPSRIRKRKGYYTTMMTRYTLSGSFFFSLVYLGCEIIFFAQARSKVSWGARRCASNENPKLLHCLLLIEHLGLELPLGRKRTAVGSAINYLHDYLSARPVVPESSLISSMTENRDGRAGCGGDHPLLPPLLRGSVGEELPCQGEGVPGKCGRESDHDLMN